MPCQLVYVEGPEVRILLTTRKAAAKHVHLVAIDNRCMMTNCLRLLLSMRLQELPTARLLLVFHVAVKVAECLHVDHPEIIEEALANIVPTKDVQFVLVFKRRMVASTLRHF